MSFRLSIPVLVILAMWGCQSTQQQPERDTEPAVTSALVGADGPTPSTLAARETLATAEALLREGDWVGARALVSVLAQGDLGPADRPRYALLAAELAIRSGDLEEASRLLLGLDGNRRVDPLARKLVTARLAAASGAPADAAAGLMALEVADDARQSLHDTIWDLAGQTPAFEALPRAATTSRVPWRYPGSRAELLRAGGWADQAQRISAWQAAWPEHPAAKRLPGVLANAGTDYARPRQVALLLPLSGPLARAGRAVRDGFIAAYLEQTGTDRFDVAVHDTEGRAQGAVYEQALADGADQLVGPLRRERVQEMNALLPEVPVLALNYLGPEPPAANLAQVGLAIEDDAATLANALRARGIARVMVLHGPHDWALRVRQALGDQGIEMISAHMLPEIRTITESVGSALGIEASYARRTELQRLLGTPLQFMPRRRGDVEALITLVNALEMTALGPALRFHYAQDIPVFATSQTLQGGGTTTLRAMEGMLVVVLPWDAPNDPGQQLLGNAFPLEGNPFASMYALGADAFRLVERMPAANRDATTQILGNTGVLTVMNDGRIRRELALMRVTRGRLEPAAAR